MQPASQGLDAGDLHSSGQVHAPACGDQAMSDAELVKGAAGLIEQFSAMHQHGNALLARLCLLRDVGENHRFAAPGWQHEDHGAMAAAEGLPDLCDGVGLIGP